MQQTTKPNTDQLLVHRFARDQASPMPVDSNPVAIDLGAVLHAFDAQARTIELRFAPMPRHLQGNGVVHGGVVGSMLDLALALVVLGALQPPAVAVTASLHIEFQKSVMPGELRARARIDRLGSRLAFVSAQLLAAEHVGRVLARASAVMAVIS